MSANRFEPVKVGVIGMGGFGTLHALTVMGLAETELVAVVARREVSLTEFAKHGPDVPGYLDLEQAIDESGAEAWIISSSTRTHVPFTTMLLEANKPVLLEKPIAESLSEAQSLAPLVASDSSNLMLGHILLFNSEFRQLLDEVSRRGKPKFINAVRHRPVATMDLFPGESPFHLTMTHDLYCVLALMNRAEPVAFTAQTHKTKAGQVDLALGQLQWADGTIASLAASFLTTPGMAADGFDRLEAFGDGWVARLLPNPRPIELYDDKATWPMALEIRADPAGPSGMMAEEIRCFARIVRGQQTVPVGATYNDAMQVMRWLDELEQSVDAH
jgi:predicted dehydrogenase